MAAAECSRHGVARTPAPAPPDCMRWPRPGVQACVCVHACVQVRILAFSAHADLRGILGLVEAAAPRHAVVLVHGQPGPMAFLA